MRYMGLDLGTKTLGIALSDTTKTIASLYKTIRFADENYDVLLPQIKEIVNEEKVEKIVLGLPKNMNNSIGDRGETTLSFQNKLKEYLNMEVVCQDERLSTKEATYYLIEADMSRKKRKTKIDGVAATIILQTYLDKKRG